jgi:hypothetical protein
MKKILSFVILPVAIIALVFGFDLWKRETVKSQLPGTNNQYYRIVTLPIPDSLEFAGEDVPLDIFYVKESLDKEMSVNTYWHSSTLQLIRRSHRWFPLIEEILKKNNIPDDFKYLAAIESGLKNVSSPAGAKGYWQIMKATAKENGLEVNKYVDERYDVRKSTEVACRYLQHAYDKFGSWTMAAAAYNAGITGMLKQIDKQKQNSYYDLLLNDETARYIYRIMAVKLIFNDPEKFGFYLKEKDYYQPIPTKLVEVKRSVENWADFAAEHGISYKLLKYFNPWLRQVDLKNRKKKTYFIEIPMSPYDMTHKGEKL